ncbi:MAG: SMP-30/gluconolactonase/LRE family protein [Rhodospirillales bacterium]|nr:SMP-30/gluconolactonase/LRE family protein [Rhodospirillales bacterium]
MKKTLFVVSVLLLILGSYGGYIFYVTGQYKSIEPHFAGTCKAVPGVVGGEDITVHPKTGIALIASSDRRTEAEKKPTQGVIWAYDLNDVNAQPMKLTEDLELEFHAHGLSLFPEGDGGTVMAVNHRAGGGAFGSTDDSIEIFDYVNGKLTHRKTVEHELLKAVNDVVAVDGERFYATIDHGYPAGTMRVVEDYGRLSLASVVYYDGKTVTTTDAGTFRYANGINISPDGMKLYVAATTDGAISVFDRRIKTGELSGRRNISLGTGVDNIEVDAKGALWIGAHPKLFDFLGHAKDETKNSPSQVLKLTPNAYRFDVSEVYLDDGSRLSGSSVAARYGDRLLIGPVFDPKFLDCRLK